VHAIIDKSVYVHYISKTGPLWFSGITSSKLL